MNVESVSASSALEYLRSVVKQETPTMQILGRDGHLIAISSSAGILEKVIINLEQEIVVLRDEIFRLKKRERKKKIICREYLPNSSP